MSNYCDENGNMVDDFGDIVEETLDAWAVRESLQDAQRGAAGGHSEGRGHPGEGQGRP